MMPFLLELGQDLLRPLPGREAQYRMAPRPRPVAELGARPRAGALRGGVLVLFYPYDDHLYFPLILRPDYDGVHSGQVSLPGGRFEEGDEDLVATALRETHEEIGVGAESVHILGSLTPLYIYPSNFLVQPIVGWTPQRPVFQPDAHEVAELIEAPLLDLLDPATLRQEEWQLHDRAADVPFFYICHHRVWGATAMMLSELLSLPALRNLPKSLAGGRG